MMNRLLFLFMVQMFLFNLPAQALQVEPIADTLVKTECSACHFAYQPDFLPAHSWRKLMNTLDDHFGEDASLDDKTVTYIVDFLVAGAADTQKSRIGYLMMHGVGNDSEPVRITEMPAWKFWHENPRSQAFYPKRGSMGDCVACHRSANSGAYGSFPNELAQAEYRHQDIGVQQIWIRPRTKEGRDYELFFTLKNYADQPLELETVMALDADGFSITVDEFRFVVPVIAENAVRFVKLGGFPKVDPDYMVQAHPENVRGIFANVDEGEIEILTNSDFVPLIFNFSDDREVYVNASVQHLGSPAFMEKSSLRAGYPMMASTMSQMFITSTLAPPVEKQSNKALSQ